MKLIGMLDSPYVRRAAISARLLGLVIPHEQISVFRHFKEFHAINPLVKAPTLVLDDGEIMVDSSLIIEHFEDIATDGKTLLPSDPALRLRCRRLTGLGVAACDKSVQTYYELGLRPQERRWSEWIERIRVQLSDTYTLLEQKCDGPGPWLCGDTPSQADVTVAVAWRFTRHVLPAALESARFPRLAALSEHAEALPAFRACDFE